MNNKSLYALWIVWSIANTYPVIAADITRTLPLRPCHRLLHLTWKQCPSPASRRWEVKSASPLPISCRWEHVAVAHTLLMSNAHHLHASHKPYPSPACHPQMLPVTCMPQLWEPHSRGLESLRVHHHRGLHVGMMLLSRTHRHIAQEAEVFESTWASGSHKPDWLKNLLSPEFQQFTKVPSSLSPLP